MTMLKRFPRSFRRREPGLDNSQASFKDTKDRSARANEQKTTKQTDPREKYGLFSFNSSKLEEAKHFIDIIAVHGLDGDWEKTWTDTNGSLWLRDFLPSQLPEARIMSFGYNAACAFSSSINNIESVAAMLLDRLDGKRQHIDQRNRPLIFISHSLGGIIVKKALILAHERSGHYKNLSNSVRGLVFFGVPHHGTDWAQFATRLLKTLQLQSSTDPNFLAELQRNSRTLADISKQFVERAKNLHIRTFYETKMLFNQFVVDQDSTLLNLPNELPVGIDGADHWSICKFSKIDSEKYFQVSTAIKKLVNLALAAPAVSPPSQEARFILPFERDREFVGRKDVIESIENKFKIQRRVALAGIGGVGKSQIAIEYCFRYRERYPNGHVFWMYADTFLSISQAYMKIARTLELPGLNGPNFGLFQCVFEALSSEMLQWLLIIDNADDRDLFFENLPNPGSKQRMRLADFLPNSPNGSILITTRDEVVGQRLTGKIVIKINTLTKSDAKELLQSKAPQKSDLNQTMSDELLRTLEYLPLAINQAATFMRETGTSVEEYLQMLRKDSDLVYLMNKDRPDLRRDASSLNSVIQTWEVSFERIRDKWHRAAESLSLIVMLDRQGIPKFLLKEAGESQALFLEAFAVLKAFSLITIEEGGENFGIHRLVQISTQLWLQVRKETEKWQAKALRILAKTFPTGEYKNWNQCQLLYSHAQAVVQYSFSSESDLDALHANLLQNLASYDFGKGKYSESERKQRQVRELRLRILGPENPDTLASAYHLANALHSQGKYREAEELHRETLEIRRKVMGPENPTTLQSINNLSITLHDQGKHREAEKLRQQTLKICRETLGPQHPDTWTNMNNLAMTFHDQGKYREAEELHQEALEMRRNTLGPEHPDTLISMNNLAYAFHAQGRYQEAKEIYQKTLEIRQENLGSEHPDTLININNLADVLHSQRQYREAEGLHRQTLEIRQKVLGSKHPDTLQSMTNLAYAFHFQRQYQQAEELHQQTLEIRRQTLGPEHPDILQSMNGIAIVFIDQRRYREAEKLQRQILESCLIILGPEHPDTLHSMNNLGHALHSQKKYEAAEGLHQQTLEIRRKILGLEQPDTLKSMDNLAITRYARGKYPEAEELHKQVLEISRKLLGPEHPDTLQSMDSLAITYQAWGKYQEAEKLYRQNFEIRRKVLGPKHPDTLQSMKRLAAVFHSQGRSQEAAE